jgi:hypothetical protein
MTFTDLLADCSPTERAYFEQHYMSLLTVEVFRRLRVAEWNADCRKEDIIKLKARIKQLEAELRPPDTSTPPDGYDLPKAAADLLACADEHGWLSLTAWGERSNGDPLVTIQLLHKAVGGRVWKVDHISWIRSGAGTSMKRFGTGRIQTPEYRAWHDAPSLKCLCELIAANPA